MYMFLPDDRTPTPEEVVNNYVGSILIKHRDKLVKCIRDLKKGVKHLSNTGLYTTIACVQRKLDYTRIEVSYINYILDTYRLDLPSDKKKPYTIKSFNNYDYNYCSNQSIINVNILIRDSISKFKREQDAY